MTIVLDNVSLSYPVYGPSARSAKRALFNAAAGGRLIRVDDHHVEVNALDKISLTVAPGERLGLFGRNGAGKTTLLRTIAGIYEPDQGTVRVDGRITSLFGLNLGIDREATGYENIQVALEIYGSKRATTDALVEAIAEFSELGDYLYLPMHTYSQGMAMRLAFSTATAVNTDVLLLDEWIGAGDEAFREKAAKRMRELVTGSRVVVLASQNRNILSRFCDKIALLHKGRVIDILDSETFRTADTEAIILAAAEDDDADST